MLRLQFEEEMPKLLRKGDAGKAARTRKSAAPALSSDFSAEEEQDLGTLSIRDWIE